MLIGRTCDEQMHTMYIASPDTSSSAHLIHITSLLYNTKNMLGCLCQTERYRSSNNVVLILHLKA